jgi:hypothetical protein
MKTATITAVMPDLGKILFTLEDGTMDSCEADTQLFELGQLIELNNDNTFGEIVEVKAENEAEQQLAEVIAEVKAKPKAKAKAKAEAKPKAKAKALSLLAEALQANPPEKVKELILGVKVKTFEDNYTINEETGCWVWHGTKCHSYGYYKRQLAHRYAYSQKFELIPGQRVEHTCGNPLCVNPDHVRIKQK